MPLPRLTIYRHDRRKRALITLAGEIDLESAPLVRASLERCLRDGIRIIDVDLTPVTFCDCSGLNAFLYAAQRTREAGGSLRLHNPPPSLARILELTGCGFLFPAFRSAICHRLSGTSLTRSLRPCRSGVSRWWLSCRAMCGEGPAQAGAAARATAGEPSTMDAVRLRRSGNRRLAQALGGELADLYVDSRETSDVAAVCRSGC